MTIEAEGRLEQLQTIRNSGLSPHQQDLQKLQERFDRLSKLRDLTPKEMCAALMDMVKEADRKRRKELKAADNMERQAQASRMKADGLSMFSSIIYSIIDRYVIAAERDAEELKMLEAERLEGERLAKEKELKDKQMSLDLDAPKKKKKATKKKTSKK